MDEEYIAKIEKLEEEINLEIAGAKKKIENDLLAFKDKQELKLQNRHSDLKKLYENKLSELAILSDKVYNKMLKKIENRVLHIKNIEDAAIKEAMLKYIPKILPGEQIDC